MSEVTKADIYEVHQRIDIMVTEQSKTNVELAKIATKLDLLPQPPERPCHYYDELRSVVRNHLDEAKETRKLWQTPIVKMTFDLVKMGIVALATYLFVRKNQ